MQPGEFEYVGFWVRFGAFLFDTFLLGMTGVILCLIFPSLVTFLIDPVSQFLSDGISLGPSSSELFTAFVLPLFLIVFLTGAVVTPLFWIYKQATFGKLAISAKIVDERTGSTPSVGQFVIRYFAYIISTLPLWLGFIWIAFDDRKQGWHDKLAGTVVVRKPRRGETMEAGIMEAGIMAGENHIDFPAGLIDL